MIVHNLPTLRHVNYHLNVVSGLSPVSNWSVFCPDLPGSMLISTQAFPEEIQLPAEFIHKKQKSCC